MGGRGSVPEGTGGPVKLRWMPERGDRVRTKDGAFGRIYEGSSATPTLTGHNTWRMVVLFDAGPVAVEVMPEPFHAQDGAFWMEV